MPPKIRELIADLEAAGFEQDGGKGSHRKFRHPATPRRVVLSGNLGSDAKRYQVKEVEEAIKEAKT
jgi:predicted RNA binding protein YcfA (HicA-like mRNA interferase family)